MLYIHFSHCFQIVGNLYELSFMCKLQDWMNFLETSFWLHTFQNLYFLNQPHTSLAKCCRTVSSTHPVPSLLDTEQINTVLAVILDCIPSPGYSARNILFSARDIFQLEIFLFLEFMKYFVPCLPQESAIFHVIFIQWHALFHLKYC